MLTLSEERIDPALWELYRKWLLKKAFFEHDNYEKLTSFLHSTDYKYVIETDPDRIATGFTTLWDSAGPIDVRMEFNKVGDTDLKFVNYYEKYPIARERDRNVSCSVLEEMVRIAFANEDYYMYRWCEPDDPDIYEYQIRGGKIREKAIRIDRGPHLFELFLRNLGLMKFDDSCFDENLELTDFIVHRWLFRLYDFDGTGGIVPVPGTDRDQRFIPISSQIGEYANAYTFGYCWEPVPKHKEFICGRI